MLRPPSSFPSSPAPSCPLPRRTAAARPPPSLCHLPVNSFRFHLLLVPAERSASSEHTECRNGTPSAGELSVVAFELHQLQMKAIGSASLRHIQKKSTRQSHLGNCRHVSCQHCEMCPQVQRHHTVVDPSSRRHTLDSQLFKIFNQRE